MIDMSDRSIDSRLRAVSELRDLCLKLGDAELRPGSGQVAEVISTYSANEQKKDV